MILKRYGSFGRANSPFGRDPVGAKGQDNAFDTDKSPLVHKYRGGGPLSTEATEAQRLIKQLNINTKSAQILKESLSKKTKDLDKGTILDEKNLIGNEKA